MWVVQYAFAWAMHYKRFATESEAREFANKMNPNWWKTVYQEKE